MPFHVSLVGRKNLSREIYRQIVRAILDQRLPPGARLTPSRDLAKSLSVSRMTVTIAYERLAGEGFVTSRPGAGTFVSEAMVRITRQPAKHVSDGGIKPRAIWNSIVPYSFGPLARYDFRTGLPDASLFPHRAWYRAVTRALASPEMIRGVYGEPAGLRELRVAIARHIGFSRGIETSADDILVTNGTQQALDLVARALLEPGDTVAIEDPCYGLPRVLFKTLAMRVVGVPVDSEGLVVTALPRGARAVYVTPSHPYPLGVTKTLPRRQALLAWAQRNHAAIIEDDYDCEFRFGGRPLEPLQTIDTQGSVIYIGSFSKTVLPTLRLGFVIAPRSLRQALQSVKFLSDWHSSLLPQAALARFMENGDFGRHLRRTSSAYAERRSIIVEVINRDFGEHLELVPSGAGLHLAALARNATADRVDTIVGRAAEHGVVVLSLARFAVDPSRARQGLVLGYGGIPTSRIREGLRRLRGCFEQ
jgi:GntR family transcriptional regulator/MocR family aminotransferase